MICWLCGKTFTVNTVPPDESIDVKGVDLRSSCLCLHGYGGDESAATLDLMSSANCRRFDRFMALVVANTSNPQSNGESSVCVDAAIATMSEIERRVEAGTLFEEVKP